MTNILPIIALVFPGYFAVLLNEFIWGRRGRPAADRILDASLLSIVAEVLITLFGHQLFNNIKFNDSQTVTDFFSDSALFDLCLIAVVAVGVSIIVTSILRNACFRRLCKRLFQRTFVFDVLYDKYLDSLKSFREVEKYRKAAGKPQRQPIAVVKLKSGVHIKGFVEALADNQIDGGMFISNPDFYDNEFKQGQSLDVFMRDSVGSFIFGSGIYLRRSEIEMVWLGVDEMALVKYRTKVIGSTDTGQKKD